MKKYISFIVILAVSSLWNLALMEWYLHTRHEKPLILAQIPESTQRFLTDLGEKIAEGGLHLFILHPVGSFGEDSWTNKNDYGHQAGFVKEETDTLFALYCDVPDSVLIAQVRRYAHEAIQPMAQLMGHYVYPYMVKGRKLPIYLCTSEDSYQTVCSELVGRNDDYSTSWGLCVTLYCGADVQTAGIVINGGSILQREENADKYLKSTLWHEMNHYVYFQSLQLSREVTPYKWVFEGLAEYFSSKVIKQTTQLDADEERMVMSNKLESTFSPLSYNYTGGELFYEYLEQSYGVHKVVSLVRSLYSLPLSQSLAQIGLDTEQCEKEWKEYVVSTYLHSD